jgi:hypothetical protein
VYLRISDGETNLFDFDCDGPKTSKLLARDLATIFTTHIFYRRWNRLDLSVDLELIFNYLKRSFYVHIYLIVIKVGFRNFAPDSPICGGTSGLIEEGPKDCRNLIVNNNNRLWGQIRQSSN